jgi:hypothetical protein
MGDFFAGMAGFACSLWLVEQMQTLSQRLNQGGRDIE